MNVAAAAVSLLASGYIGLFLKNVETFFTEKRAL